MTVMDADEYRRFLRGLSREKIDLTTAKWPGLEMAEMDNPTAEAQRAFAQQRAYKQFYASYASTVHGGLEPVFDEKESTKRTPDGPDGSRTAGPSLELRQDIQASRSSPVVHAPPAAMSGRSRRAPSLQCLGRVTEGRMLLDNVAILDFGSGATTRTVKEILVSPNS